MHDLKLLKDNSSNGPDFTPEQWIEQFMEYLQGNPPDGISHSKGHQPKMSIKKAWSIIWYLQEQLPVFPDNIEKCSVCDSVFDSYSQGIYWETKGKHYCGSCEYLVPWNYDKGKK